MGTVVLAVVQPRLRNLKGRFADADNSCCDTLVREYREKRAEAHPICPWENPTALVYLGDSYGM
jgi:hypothetical protein